MAIVAVPIFDPNIPYAGAPGCLVCHSNVSTEGQKVGTQAVDLGTGDEFLGAYALCFDCAIQVARAIRYVSMPEVLDLLEEARQLSENAELNEAAAAAEAAQARLDRDTVERLVGPYQPAPEAPADVAEAV